MKDKRVSIEAIKDHLFYLKRRKNRSKHPNNIKKVIRYWKDKLKERKNEIKKRKK